MKRLQIFLISIFLTISISLFSSVSSKAVKATAPLFTGMGEHHHAITTKSPEAQRYFDQGLVLAYGFNHAEAARSFRQAIKLDSNCAMCNWGLAYVLGPNINAKMEDDAVPESYAAMQQAVKLAPNSSKTEQAYIKALTKRYTKQPLEDRNSLDLAFAKAMGKVSQQYPNDLDAATIYAEALMDTMPWDYWTEKGEPKPETQKVLNTLEAILKREPEHPGANHLYIHAVEAVRPQAGVAAADRLGSLVPGSGHLVHMPSHIYIRVGRYHDAALANQKAIAVDNDYITQCHAQGVYPLAYMPHNHHFLWFAATLEGNSKLATEAAKNVAAMVEQKMMREPGMGTLQHFTSVPLFTMIRFGQWDEILAVPQPEADLKYPTGVWHYARGLAYNAQSKITEAEQELEALDLLAQDPELEKVTIWDINTTQNILLVATEVLTGEIAAKQEQYPRAIAHLRQAVKLEDALNYDEPADWSTPARQYLGAALLKAKRYEAAAQIYQQDLAIYPDNGWSLWGLAQSLQAQGKVMEAENIQRQFESAWRYADVQLTTSKY
ncbi:MAG: tetratricopeptide repeat protein [Waterburya sp.]